MRGVSLLDEQLSGVQEEPCSKDFDTVVCLLVWSFIFSGLQSVNAVLQVPSLEIQDVGSYTVM
jgi:hypothetical protein